MLNLADSFAVEQDIFVVPVQRHFLIYSPQLRVTALLDAASLGLLRQALLTKTHSPLLSSDLQELVALLSRKERDNVDTATGLLEPVFLGIIPTRACNLRCRYCDFGAHHENHQVMDLPMADAAVTWYADFLSRSGCEIMAVHFFGGEPFVAKDVVEAVVHKGRSLAVEKQLTPHFEVSTNGFFQPDYALFVGDYFDAVVLSFDGLPEVHNYHRPMDYRQGSFEQVKESATILSNSPTELNLRCCVSSLNVSSLEETTAWFCQEFQPATINFEPLVPNKSSTKAGLAPPDPYLFAKNFYQAQQLGQQFGINVVFSAADITVNRSSFCPVGKDALILSPDGRISSCYLPREVWEDRGLNMDVGHAMPGGKVVIDHLAISRLRQLVSKELKPRCINCFCQNTCAGGCHVNNTFPGCGEDYGNFCIQTRLLTANKLLDELGLHQVVQKLLDDKDAMEFLALHPSDRLCDKG